MGGLGKTTLAQMVFNDQRVTEHFYPRIWVCVSEDFDEKKLLKAIVEFIEEKPLGGNMDLAALQKKLQKLLNGKRYLLVLDDVWNEDPEKWASLRSVSKVGASGASILTATRLQKVGSIMGTLQPYVLSNLSQKHCWLLFKQRAFGQQEEISPNLEAIGKEIVKKSGGVPLAAKTLGGILRFKREEREWDRVRDSEIWDLPQGERSILPTLRISYHHLPLDLRQCFVYCAVFPKDTKMEKKNLITLWMAHNFLLSRENLEPEDVGNDVWNELGELGNLNLYGSIEIRHLERVKNDRDAKEVNLCAKGNLHSLSLIWDEHEPHRYESKEVLEALKPHPNLTSLEIIGFRGFRLPNWINHSVLKNVVSIKIGSCKNCSCLPPFGELPCLESLELQDGSVEVEYIDVHSGRFPSLRRLWIRDFLNLKGLVKKEGEEQFPVLEEMKIVQCPVFVIPTLSSVKKLEFEGEADARGFRSISNLRSLTSLLLSSNQEATSLPEEMFKNLANLKHLRLSFFDKLKELPTSLSSLSALKILDIVQCKALESLPKEGVKGLSSLTELSIRFCWMLKCLPEGLQHLTTLAILGSAPHTNFNSIFNLRALTSLNIGLENEATSLPEEMFKSLANLKYLTVHSMYNLKEFPTSLASLNALKSLEIAYCQTLESLPEEGVKGLTSLTDLSIEHCRMLECLPKGLQHLTALTTLTIWGCEILFQRCEEGTGQDWHKIAHIPNLSIHK